MNAQTEIPPYAYDPSTFDHAAFHGFSPPPGATRHEGWTPDKQRCFLEALSEGLNVIRACAIVGLSRQSAYALRSSPRGQSFALGWDAAVLKARDALTDDLMDRAFNGVRDTVTRDDGSIITRHRHDNRHGMAMLNRLDRMADAAKGPGIAAAARLIAADFAQYLDLIGRDGGPARAGAFLAARIEPAGEDDLAPIRALARADRWLRTHTDIAEPLDTADLDPAERAHWTAEQWIRAEAIGLVALAPDKRDNCDPDTRDNRDSCQPCQPAAVFEDEPVWWDEDLEEWRTRFPPPADFDGLEHGYYGDEDYSRALSPAEQAVYDADDEAELAAREAVEARQRDLYFGFLVDPADETPVDTPAEPSDAEDGHIVTGSCVEPPSAQLRADTGGSPMSIFGKIKDAIFGHKAAAPAQAPAAQAPTQTSAMPQMGQPAPQPAPAAPVDVEAVLMVFETERGTADLNWRTSIVDLMKLLGLDSSLDNRKELATELGYTGAKDGSAEMNIWLHKAVMQELAKNGGNVPASLKD
ncbi:DUF3597 domain-containing protein [Sphingomonas sp. Root241]|uniref:DUF3597 domain-containing protein n=1 Tax=Sphingomonas sp. Root241 TaxID=1736501 RepID=UPI000B007CD1|nr:DUF3597 domain-containing protein [Sphingomonas sp. Root241]